MKRSQPWPGEPAFVKGAHSSGGGEDPDPDDLPTDPEIGPALPQRSLPPERALRRDGTEWVPLDWALRRVRTHSLLSGVAGGALVAFAFLAWHPDATRAPSPAPEAPPEAPVVATVVERAPVARKPAVRRVVPVAPRVPEVGVLAPARDGPESGWFLVEDEAEAERTTPPAETASGADATPVETPGETAEGTSPSDETAPGLEATLADPRGDAEAAPSEAGLAIATGTAEPADAAAAAGPPPSDGVSPATGHAPDAYEVAAALRERRADIEGCLAEASAAADAASEPQRRLRLVVVIDPSGRVSDALLDDAPGDSTPLGACLLRLAQELSFAPFEGDATQVRLALSHAPR